jgi:GNAT superfamily N-acetyltransferase
MITVLNNRQIVLRQLTPGDPEGVAVYLRNLSPLSRQRFGPHGYERETIGNFYSENPDVTAYLAIDALTLEIVAYFIVKRGFLQHDSQRLRSYGLDLSPDTDCAFAPSVADRWQGCGLGRMVLQFVISRIKNEGIKRMILWGGVQNENSNAMRFYTGNGFRRIGEFEYHGLNTDMILDIP